MTRSTYNKSHDERTEQDLLLLAHGALPLGRRLRLSAHLKRCPECRTRLAALTQASLLLASAVRDPGQPAWSRNAAVSRAAAPGKRPVLPLLLLLIGIIVTLCLVAWTSLAPDSRPAARAAISGCRPDLPNSRCR